MLRGQQSSLEPTGLPASRHGPCTRAIAGRVLRHEAEQASQGTAEAANEIQQWTPCTCWTWAKAKLHYQPRHCNALTRMHTAHNLIVTHSLGSSETARAQRARRRLRCHLACQLATAALVQNHSAPGDGLDVDP